MCVNEQDVPLSSTQTHTTVCHLNHSTSQLLTRLTYCCCSHTLTHMHSLTHSHKMITFALFSF
eukprot:m.208002 g.208002  ORF g.208002 m.208002 type:complete len:63 (+) comp15038_c1_seq2:225-413(+)